jgi:hypothetical protein
MVLVRVWVEWNSLREGEWEVGSVRQEVFIFEGERKEPLGGSGSAVRTWDAWRPELSGRQPPRYPEENGSLAETSKLESPGPGFEQGRAETGENREKKAKGVIFLLKSVVLKIKRTGMKGG